MDDKPKTLSLMQFHKAVPAHVRLTLDNLTMCREFTNCVFEIKKLPPRDGQRSFRWLSAGTKVNGEPVSRTEVASMREALHRVSDYTITDKEHGHPIPHIYLKLCQYYRGEHVDTVRSFRKSGVLLEYINPEETIPVKKKTSRSRSTSPSAPVSAPAPVSVPVSAAPAPAPDFLDTCLRYYNLLGCDWVKTTSWVENELLYAPPGLVDAPSDAWESSPPPTDPLSPLNRAFLRCMWGHSPEPRHWKALAHVFSLLNLREHLFVICLLTENLEDANVIITLAKVLNPVLAALDCDFLAINEFDEALVKAVVKLTRNPRYLRLLLRDLPGFARYIGTVPHERSEGSIAARFDSFDPTTTFEALFKRQCKRMYERRENTKFRMVSTLTRNQEAIMASPGEACHLEIILGRWKWVRNTFFGQLEQSDPEFWTKLRRSRKLAWVGISEEQCLSVIHWIYTNEFDTDLRNSLRILGWACLYRIVDLVGPVFDFIKTTLLSPDTDGSDLIRVLMEQGDYVKKNIPPLTYDAFLKVIANRLELKNLMMLERICYLSEEMTVVRKRRAKEHAKRRR